MLKPTTKMAYQTAIALALSEWIGLYLYTERHDWITLTTMAVMTQTWGETLQRSLERIGMTILGGSVGTLLYFSLSSSSSSIFLWVFFFIFCTIYTAGIHRLVFLFFLTCFVVFIFALLGEWNWILLKERIIDTVLGALIALLVSYFFFPVKSNDSNLLTPILLSMRTVLSMMAVTTVSEIKMNLQSLLATIQKLKKHATVARYEVWLSRLSAADFNTLLNKLFFCAQWMVCLTEELDGFSSSLDMDEKQMLQNAIKAVQHNLSAILSLLEGHTGERLVSVTDVFDVLDQVVDSVQKHVDTSNMEAMSVFHILYFFNRLNHHVTDIYWLIRHVD